jgi:DNA-binding NtrC family response regulator
MPHVKLSEEAIQFIQKYRWSGNIRQLRNFAEQLSVLETNRDISLATIQSYLPAEGSTLPSVISGKKSENDFSTERDILYKVLFDMKSDLHDLKKLTLELIQNGSSKVQETNKNLIQKVFGQKEETVSNFADEPRLNEIASQNNAEQEEFDDDDDTNYLMAETIDEEEVLKLEQKEIELIKKSLDRHKGKRKAAADELGISERTLYRKIKQYDL